MKCPYCGAENNDGAKFCKECGKSIQKSFNYVCPKCGSPVEEKSKFCDNCGLELAWVDVDYDRIPVPIKHKDSKVKQAGQQEQRSMPQLIASIVTASLVFVSLLNMFIGLFGDVMVTKISSSALTSVQFTYFFGDAAKRYSSIPDGEMYRFMKGLMVVHHVLYFLMFAAVIGTIIALAIVITFNFIKGKKLCVKPLLIPMIASLAYTAYTLAIYGAYYNYPSIASEEITIGYGPVLVVVGAMIGALALISSSFYKWPLSKHKILQHSFFAGAMIFLIIACSFLVVAPISIKTFDETGTMTEMARLSPFYLLQAAISAKESSGNAPAYYAASILAFTFSLVAIIACLFAIYSMKKQRIIAIILGVASIPMLIVPSLVLAHDYAFATVASGCTIKFGITPSAIVYAVFVGLFAVSLIVSMILKKKASGVEEPQQA